MNSITYIQLSVIPGDEAYKVQSIAHAAFESYTDINQIEDEITDRLNATFPNGKDVIYKIERSDNGSSIAIRLLSISAENQEDDDIYIVITAE